MGVPPVLIQILEWDFPVHKNQPALGSPHDELETSIWHTWIRHGNVPQLPHGTAGTIPVLKQEKQIPFIYN